MLEVRTGHSDPVSTASSQACSASPISSANPQRPRSVTDCAAPAGYVADASDCNDLDAAINPDAVEIPADGIDQNCDGIDPLVRVVRVGDRAWPVERLRASGRIEEAGFVLTWTEGQASALSTEEIADGHEVGNIQVTTPDGAPVVHELHGVGRYRGLEVLAVGGISNEFIKIKHN